MKFYRMPGDGLAALDGGMVPPPDAGWVEIPRNEYLLAEHKAEKLIAAHKAELVEQDRASLASAHEELLALGLSPAAAERITGYRG